MKSFIIAPNTDKITSNCNEINEHIKNPKFKHLKDELSKIKITLESFPFFLIRSDPQYGHFVTCTVLIKAASFVSLSF